ncbi:MAG: hypothetical protein ACHQNA_13460 [Acidimicrobiales bacterium]
MQMISPPRPARQLGSVVGGTLLGAALVATGLGFAFLVIETPLVSRLLPASGVGSSQLASAIVAWALALIAGAGLSVAGTNQLAATLASVRVAATPGPVVRMLSSLPGDVSVATDVVLHDGRPIPELVVGPFGIAVVHELGPRETIRPIGNSWETRTREGWVPTEYPLDRVARDADRVRHWLMESDLDFVVRVYAALVTTDSAIPRSPLCAVITDAQIPAWIEALPRQRSLTDGRRNHLLARIRESVAPQRR